MDRINTWIEGLPGIVKALSLTGSFALGVFAGVARFHDLPGEDEQNSLTIQENTGRINTLQNRLEDRLDDQDRMLCLILLDESPSLAELADCIATSGGEVNR